MESSQATTERFNTVVIGAGQAGLATGYHLAQSGVDFVILEAADRVGHSWRRRWDSLRLFTPSCYNNLPGEVKCPGPDRWYLPTKDEAADYLEQYAAHFSLPVRTGVRVTGLGREGDRYVVTSDKGRFEADNVVVATGSFQRPRIPEFASELSSSIMQIHSSEYRNPAQMKEGDTLVVGAATSGCQIASELAQSRRVYLAGRDVTSIPRRILGLNTFHLFRFITTRPATSFVGKKMQRKLRGHGWPLIRFSYKDVLKSGVERVPRVTGVRDGKPVIDDKAVDVSNVIWCTGYTNDFSWIDLPIHDEAGYPRQQRGLVEGEPGLFFMGLAFQHSQSSALIYGVARDSKYVVDELLRRAVSRRPALGTGGGAEAAAAQRAS